MENKNCQLLSDYIRSILYDTNVEILDLDQLDEPFYNLGKDLQLLHDAFNNQKRQLKEQEAKLQKHSENISDLSAKAYYDPVTSVYNRHYFEEYMDKVLKEQDTVTLGYLDLDGLKYVNDHYGHTEGDQYIATFARMIQKHFRSEDVFARIGGDEFCIVLKGKLVELTRRKLENVREDLIRQNTKEYPVSFSYGICEVSESSGHLTLEHILNEADTQMYDYKRRFKSRSMS
jgi:diguanylate cyclase (GGDEF)-like protein